MFVGFSLLTNVRSLTVRQFSFSSDFSAIISDRDFRSVFRFSITFRSFIEIRWFKRLEFRLEILFLFNQLKQVFATVKFDLDPEIVNEACFFRRLTFVASFELILFANRSS